MHYHQLLKGVGAGLALISLGSVPALVGLVSQFRKKGQKQEIYEDADGRSTPEAVKSYSAKLLKILLLLLSAAGLSVSIALSVHMTLHVSQYALVLENWFTMCAWVS